MRGGQSCACACVCECVATGTAEGSLELEFVPAWSRVASVQPTSVSWRQKLARDDCNQLISIVCVCAQTRWARRAPEPETLSATQSSAGLICGYWRGELRPPAQMCKHPPPSL